MVSRALRTAVFSCLLNFHSIEYTLKDWADMQEIKRECVRRQAGEGAAKGSGRDAPEETYGV